MLLIVLALMFCFFFSFPSVQNKRAEPLYTACSQFVADLGPSWQCQKGNWLQWLPHQGARLLEWPWAAQMWVKLMKHLQPFTVPKFTTNLSIYGRVITQGLSFIEVLLRFPSDLLTAVFPANVNLKSLLGVTYLFRYWSVICFSSQ